MSSALMAMASWRGRDTSTELSVAFVKFQLDGQPAANIHHLVPRELHDMEIEVRVSRWPEGATHLVLTPISAEPKSTYPGTADPDMVSGTGIVPRLLSIQHNRGIGYAFNTGYQVLNAVMQSTPGHQQWHTLYLMAVKAYGLEAHFTPRQAKRYASWRQSVIDKVNAGDETHLRPARYDAVLSVLFPEMAPGLAKGYGSTSRADLRILNMRSPEH